MYSLRAVAAALATVLGLAALAPALASLFGGVSPRLDILSHAAPIYVTVAGAAIFPGVISALMGKRGPLVIASIALAASLVVMAPEAFVAATTPRREAVARDRLKVIQFNALGGENRAAARAGAWLVSQDPDVVFLQEPGDAIEPLLRAGYHMACKGCGAAVLTKERPLRYHFVAGREGGASALAAATLRDGLGEFTVVSVHRAWPSRIREYARQERDLARLAASEAKGRMIVGGDFNSTPWSYQRRREDSELGLVRRTVLLPTWPAARISHNRLPSPFPYLLIDHVYAGAGWATINVTAGPRLGSDHLPVIVTLARRSDPADGGATRAVSPR